MFFRIQSSDSCFLQISASLSDSIIWSLVGFIRLTGPGVTVAFLFEHQACVCPPISCKAC